jgi:hypothetical protein
LQERDGDEEPAADDDGEDADDEAAHEEQRRLARKQPRRDRANSTRDPSRYFTCRPRRYAPPSPSASSRLRTEFLPARQERTTLKPKTKRSK